MIFKNEEDRYIISRWMYSIGKPIMSDGEYNSLHRYLKSQNKLPEYTERSWSSDPCPKELLTAYGLEDAIYEVKLLDKTESIESFTTKEEIDLFYTGMNNAHVVSFKEDGFNIQATYYNNKPLKVHTRGRSTDAMDVSQLVDILPQNISLSGEVKIVGELTLTHNNFEELKKLFPEKKLTSQRAAVRTAIANKNAIHLLTFSAFDIIVEGEELHATKIYYLLNEWNFLTPEYRIVNSIEELYEAITIMSERVKSYPKPTDGLVVRADLSKVMRAIRVGYWREDVIYSYITGYDESFGPSRLGLKLKIRPIKLSNSTQSKVNVTNYAIVKENKLYPGTPIAFSLVSSAIADIDLRTTKLLQEQWKNHYDVYCDKIDCEEKFG